MTGKKYTGSTTDQHEANTGLMNRDEVAEFLGVSTRWVIRNAKAQGIPAYRIGARFIRYRKEDLIEWVKAQQVER